MASQSLTTIVYFSIQCIRDKRVNQNQLAAAYAAALEAITGQPLSLGRPQHKEESDWSDYDNPVEEHWYQWGRKEYAVRAMFRGQFIKPGRTGGEIGYWSALGLPEGVKLRGQSKLHVNWQSFAELTVEAEPAQVQLCSDRFHAALAAVDVLKEPDGIAIQAVEDVLTQLCWYQEAMDDEQAAKLLPAIKAVDVHRPVGAAARYLLACIYLAQKNAAAAAPLLSELAEQKAALAFSHGIVGGRDDNGLLALVAWQDKVPPGGNYYEVLSAQALAAELTGDKKRAVELYRTVKEAKIKLTSPEAAKQLARLG